MLKILHVSGARGWGGNEQQLIDLIYELKLKNTENIILGVGDSMLENECSKRDILFIKVPETKLNRFNNYAFLKKKVKELKPDVLHLHTSDSLTVFVLTHLLYGLKTPSVFSKKGMGKSSSILSKIKYNNKKLSAIICVSNKVKTEFSELLNPQQQKKLKVIYDGISISRMKDATESIQSKFKIETGIQPILHIGNHVPAKSLPTLIEMMNILVNELNHKNIKLIQIGEFNQKITPEIKEMIQKYNLENHIEMTGFVAEASSFIGQFDVFVMSSVREGFPLTIYEAFYEKTAVASTKAGGIPEIIKDGENGFLAEVEDSHALALKLAELLQNPEKRKKFSEKAYYTLIENFTAEKCAGHTLSLYQQIIK